MVVVSCLLLFPTVFFPDCTTAVGSSYSEAVANWEEGKIACVDTSYFVGIHQRSLLYANCPRELTFS